MAPRSKRDRSAQVTPRQGAAGVVRIIGGQWRSRKLHFTSAEGLRPSSDRIRETVFNWLAPYVAGARCLDLFAGSGALGLEALSRGAAHCHFVEKDRATAQQIRQHLQTLACRDADVVTTSATQFLTGAERGWHIVFLDPPFNKDLLMPAIDALQDRLGEGALVYVETAKGEPVTVPSSWRVVKHKTAGQVEYRLYEVEA